MPKNHALGVRPFCRCAGFLFALQWLVPAFAPAALAQTSPGPSQTLITQSIDEGNLIVLAGNTRPEARNPANDRGIVPDSLPLPHMMLQLRRPAAQEQAFVTLIDQLHDPKSPNFHHWLSASEISAQFGPAASDIQTITGWLAQHGFIVNTVYSSSMVIDYSGTAGQIRTAFHTEIHNLSVNGVAHIANMSDPQIPAALTPAVVGIVSLHDFKPRPLAVYNQHPTPQDTVSGSYYVTPPDLATIYNFKPLFNAGMTGQGQMIYLLEDTDLYANSDWTTFRSGFGLSGYTDGSLNTVHPAPPSGPNNCSDPGVNGDDGEAIIDAEYSSAAAPSAAIVIASCAGTAATFGGVFALQNLVNGSNPPAIISNSYGTCESVEGASANAMYYTVYGAAVAEGMSIFAAAGDQDASSCDDNYPATGFQTAYHGIAVNGSSSTPYNVAVGGTDFSDTYSGTNSTYWNSTNTSSHGSAKSYIPEIPWNDTCGSQLFATFNGYSTTYGSSGFCNSTFISNNTFYLENWGGTGGPSGCATGAPSIPGVVSGTCAGYAKPTWQSGVVGIPRDGVRDLPDVSLFASFGPWKHGYIICYSDPNNNGTPCTGNPSNWSTDWGGTSFTAPIWAGIQALVNQKAGGRQGLPNYRLYQLADSEYGASGSSACNSSNGNTVSASCIFYDVTLGDNVAPCIADGGSYYNCYRPSGTYGVQSTSNSSFAPAYKTTIGWDFSTGIGTVNVLNLVMGWSGNGYFLTDTHDFNGGGKSDIAWRDTAGDLGIWLMNGTQVLSAPVLGNVPTSWTIVGQRQLNNSGYADLIWRDTAGDLAIWLMNGTQIVSAPVLGNVPTSWSIVGTSAYNPNTGYAEWFWRNTNGDVAIWEINGTQILAAPDLGNVPTSWTIVGTGDFSGTGNTDILWRSSTGDVAIWFMNGTQIVSAPDFINVPTSWTIVGTGDFNGDGKTDILWRNANGDVAIWLMNGTQILSSAILGTVPTSWTIAETGDFNGDGFSDILWRSGTGDVAIWFMNGTQIVSSPDFVNVPTNWTIQGANAD
jgi:hypothetical protein